MTLRRRLLSVAGLVASLLLVWAATAGILWQSTTPAATVDARFASAERVIFYRVAAGRTLSLPLPAGVELLRLSTHLELPPGTTWSAERQYLYGLRVRFVAENGQTLFEGPLYTRTRQSKADPDGTGFRKEAAFTTSAGVELADERDLLLTAPLGLAGRSGRLDVTFPGSSGALLLRAYAQFAPGAPPLLASRRRALVERAESRIGKATFLPWEKLSWDTQRRLMSEHWERIDADGEPGRDFETLAVYRTDFRLPLVEVAEEQQERLEPGRAVAHNVVGPAQLMLWAWSPGAGPSGDGMPGPVSVTTLSSTGVERRLEVPVAASEPTRQAVDVPAGVHTVTVANGGPRELRYTLEGPRSAWLAPEELRSSSAAGARVALLPDLRSQDAWAVGPGCTALELELSGGAAPAARLLRLDARALAPHGVAPEVSVEVLGADDRPLARSTFPVELTASAHERAQLPFMPGTPLPCAPASAELAEPASLLEVGDRTVALTEPSSARLFLAPGTRKVRVRATAPAALSLFEFLAPAGGALRQQAPYSDHPVVGVQWKNASWNPGSWHPLRPANHAQLDDEGAAVRLLAQVRLERAGGSGRAVASGSAVTLRPLGAPATRELLEEDLPDSSEPFAKAGLHTQLLPNTPVRLHFDARAAGRPELRLDVDDLAALGSEATLKVDGRAIRRFRLRTTRDRALLPPVPPGLHEVVLETSAPGVRALLNRAPAPGELARGLRDRVVYRVGEGLRVQVPKRKGRPVTLNVVVYSRRQEALTAPSLRVRIDGGAPARTVGTLLPQITSADRALPLPAADRGAARVVGNAQDLWYGRTLFVRLGEDLAPGAHEVRLESLGGEPLWARFFIYDTPAGEVDVRQWNQDGWEEAP